VSTSIYPLVDKKAVGMSKISEIRERILNAAETRARAHGYNGFSFRELAADTNIKSASVHYHFPTKADLATALVVRYRETFFLAVDSPLEPSSSAAIQRFVGVFRQSLTERNAMCLCGMLGAENDTLPEAVQAEVSIFFAQCAVWLATSYGNSADTDLKAASTLALLEGSLLVARSLGDLSFFDKAVSNLALT
jgi:TetR/AcrR family transcriptional regulator, transcriptional repressor for nem operon